MKKLLQIALGILFATALTVRAADEPKPEAKKRPELTAEQKAVRKEMIEKYDTNKDGKLDKEERAKMSDADKEKWAKAFPPRKKKE